MIIAVPGVTEYISNSRKNAYITTIQNYIDGARNKVNSGEFSIYDKEATYYIPTSCIPLEKGGDSPFGELEESYVVVTYSGNGYDYYYTGRDSANYGVLLTYQNLLEVDYLKVGREELDLDVGVGNRETIIEYQKSCKNNDYIERNANKVIKEKGSLEDGFNELNVATAAACFDFDEETGTITGYYCGHEEYEGYDVSTYQMLDVDKCVDYLAGGEEDSIKEEARSYCSGDSEYSLKDAIADEVLPEDIVEEMIELGIIKIEKMSVIKDVVIPERIHGVAVTRIGRYAFSDADIETVVIPSTVKEMEDDVFLNNPFLYNIVNKTGRAFDWYSILGFSDSGESFETGTVTIADYDFGTSFLLQITDKKVSYDLSNMFSYQISYYGEIEYIELIDDKGYDVYYMYMPLDNNSWMKYDVGTRFGSSIVEVSHRNLDKGYNIVKLQQNYEIKPMMEAVPDLLIKVEVDGQIVFVRGFRFSK